MLTATDTGCMDQSFQDPLILLCLDIMWSFLCMVAFGIATLAASTLQLQRLDRSFGLRSSRKIGAGIRGCRETFSVWDGELPSSGSAR